MICVFTFRVSCCDARYDFRIKTMFGWSLPPVVCRMAHVLFTLSVFVYVIGAQHILCCVFVFLRLVYPMLPVSLDFPFWLPLRYSLTFICPVSCVPYVASFSGFSCLIAPSVFSNIYLSCLLCTSMLPVSLDFPFWLPLRYSLTFICPVSCVPYVASFSGFSFFDCPFGIL